MHLARTGSLKKYPDIYFFSSFTSPLPNPDPDPELESPEEGFRRWRGPGGPVGCQGHSASQIAVLAGCLIVVVSAALCSEGLNEE